MSFENVTTSLIDDGKRTMLDDWEISQFVGEFNTEAKCCVLLAVPENGDLVSMDSVRDDLRAVAAYDLVPPNSFNVQGILKEMNRTLVDIHVDPVGNNGRGANWVKRSEGPIGPYSTAFAGSLLDFSLTHNIPLRKLIGERRRSPNGTGVGSIESRLALLATLALMESQSSTGRFSEEETVRHITDQYNIPRITVNKHLKKLVSAGFVAPARGKDKIELTILPDERSTKEIILSFLTIVGGFAINSPEHVEHGKKRATEIIVDEKTLPLLIKRSYAHSGHYGKDASRVEV